MRLSIIIPAFNEAQLIERCLRSITDALTAHSASGVTGELIVADNNSTDSTACLAKQAGAQVVFEPVNQIGRARNAGAAVATGDWLLFLDADSVLIHELLGDILHVIQSKTYVACGSTLSMPGLPWCTSPRKISLYSAREIAGQILRMLLNRRRTLTNKKHLSVWYDGRR
ncbi:MAG: glycosyltransferase [Nitrospira sp.]|nr:glycosyltransferase [Nitrospira sp.]